MQSNPLPLTHLSKREENKPPLILIVGPTAVGKTELAIQLAERLHGEIISEGYHLVYDDCSNLPF